MKSDMITRRDAELAYITDSAVTEEMKACKRILQKFNTMDRADLEGLKAAAAQLLGRSENAVINPPFYCDYGFHIEAGKNLYINYNCTIVDVARVTFGDNCFVAPNTAIYTAGHPIHPVSRNSGYEYGKAVTIGDNVWIGGSTVICPGVRIGSNTVIGAGSVVTKDIPDWVLAAGNPCRVIRRITEADMRSLFHKEQIDDAAWADITDNTDSNYPANVPHTHFS